MGLAACGGRANHHASAKAGVLNIRRLARDFPALVARAAPGRLNLGVLLLGDDRVWSADSEGRYPLADLAMLPIAAAALAEIDNGRMTLSEPIRIDESHLSAPPSLIGQRFAGPTSLPAVDLIALAVQHADNTASDAIMSRIGGPGAVTAWLQSKTIDGLRVDRYAREIAVERAGLSSFRPAWRLDAAFAQAQGEIPAAAREAATQAYLRDPRDTTTAPACLSFLDQLADGRLLSPASTKFLLRLMSATTGGRARLTSALPSEATFARKGADAPTDLGFHPRDQRRRSGERRAGRRVRDLRLPGGLHRHHRRAGPPNRGRGAPGVRRPGLGPLSRFHRTLYSRDTPLAPLPELPQAWPRSRSPIRSSISTATR